MRLFHRDVDILTDAFSKHCGKNAVNYSLSQRSCSWEECFSLNFKSHTCATGFLAVAAVLFVGRMLSISRCRSAAVCGKNVVNFSLSQRCCLWEECCQFLAVAAVLCVGRMLSISHHHSGVVCTRFFDKPPYQGAVLNCQIEHLAHL